MYMTYLSPEPLLDMYVDCILKHFERHCCSQTPSMSQISSNKLLEKESVH